MYEAKDLKRVEDIIEKANGAQTAKAIQLSNTQANRITDSSKALRRALAAEDINAHSIAAIFFNRVNQLGGIVPTNRNRPRNAPTLVIETPTALASNTIYFPTGSAIALWKLEMLGQFSDGMWENARPSNHWVFWAGLNVAVGPSEVTSTARCSKKNYNLVSLKEHIGERMLIIGRIGKAIGAEAVNLGDGVDSILELFPTEQFNFREFKLKTIMMNDHLNRDSYWQGLNQNTVDKYINTTYIERDLNEDIRLIRNTMFKAKC